jgi:hypothetical protein
MASAEPLPDNTAVTDQNAEAAAAAADPEIPATAEEKEDGADVQTDTTLHGLRLGAVVAGVCLGSLMISLDVTIISTVHSSPAIPPPNIIHYQTTSKHSD